jgi:hypothetical protein
MICNQMQFGKLAKALLFIALFVLLTNFNIDKSQAPWAYPTFMYRVPITINNPNSYDLTDFQVSIIVDTASLISAGKMQSSCNDIRFADESGNALPYWVEAGCNTASTMIWVKVPFIPASSSTTIYMYYGDPSAASESDPSGVFIRIIDGLVGSWHFEEGSGTTAHDSSGNGNDGTLLDDNPTNADGDTPPQWVSGRYGGALQYDGVDDLVLISSLNPIQNRAINNFAFVVWIKSTADTGTIQQVFEGHTRTGEIYLEGRLPGTLSFYIRDDSGTAHSIATSPLALNNWYFIAGTYDGSTQRIYVNGNLISSASWSNAFTITTGISVGRDYELNIQYFRGIIDELEIFNRALSAAEISDLYNNYGYSTPNYPGKKLVRKWADIMPSFSIGPEERAPPTFSVELISPARCSVFYSDTVDFTFKAVGNRDSYSCELYIDGTPEGSTIAPNDTPVTLTVSGIGGGAHEWYVSCTADSITVESERWCFMIPITTTTTTTTTTTETRTETVTRYATVTLSTTETQTETVTQPTTITLPVTVTETVKQTVTVAKAIEKRPSRISLNVTPVSEIGREVIVRGSLYPPISGALIKLRYRIGGTEFPAEVITGPGGNFSHSFSPQMSGDWVINASWAGDATHCGSEASASFLVKKRRSEIHLEATPLVKKDGTVEIKGWVIPSEAKVTLSVSKDGREWKIAELGGNFSYKYDVRGLESGIYLLKASWGGDEEYEGNETAVPFAIGESMEVISAFPDILCYIPLVSSSTELAVSFNAKQGYLSATTGRAGETGGSLLLLIPDCCLKKYGVNVSDVIFLLDGSEAEKNVTRTPIGYLTEIKFGPGSHMISVYYLTYNLTLKVLDFQGNPAPLTKVELAGPVRRKVYTNESGIAELTLPPGKYRAVVDTTSVDIELNESKYVEIKTERGRIFVEYEEAMRKVGGLQSIIIALIILLVAVALSSYIFYRMRRRTWIERALEEYLRAMGEEVDRRRIEEILKRRSR